jgi:hypothetical protein
MSGFKGKIARMPFDAVGFQASRNEELMIPTALVEPTKNVNMHEGGLGKRGGTSVQLQLSSVQEIRGLYDFRPSQDSQFVMFSTSLGRLFANSESGLLKSGFSRNNPMDFETMDSRLFVCDGATNPQWWDGSAVTTTAVTPASDWASTGDWPFQLIKHNPGGAASALWAITRRGVYRSKLNDGRDFSDGNTKFIPVYSDSGLIGGKDFGGVLMVWSLTQGYIIDDSDPDPALWGYREMQWEGGLAHFRLIVKAGNNLIVMAEDGLIYDIKGVQATGDYQANPLTRPAHVDRWIRENVILGNINKFHAVYDRTLRAVRFWFQVGGTSPNTCLLYFIDRPAEIAFILHDNAITESGYQATCSAEIRSGRGSYAIWTGDTQGRIWRTETIDRDDNTYGYEAVVKTKRLDLDNPRMWKYFDKAALTARSLGNTNLLVRTWVNGERRPDQEIVIQGTGASFDNAFFDQSYFAAEGLIPVVVDIGAYGYDVQFEIINANPGEDFFFSSLLLGYIELGVK